MRTNADPGRNSSALRRKLQGKLSRDSAIKKRHSFGLFTGMRFRAKANSHRDENRFSTITEPERGDNEYSATMQPRSVTVQRSATTAKYLNFGNGVAVRQKNKQFEYRSQC